MEGSVPEMLCEAKYTTEIPRQARNDRKMRLPKNVNNAVNSYILIGYTTTNILVKHTT